MPKGKGLNQSGITNALGTDILHVKESGLEEKHTRISITISPILLKTIDDRVRELKKQGITINRSQFLTRAAANIIKEKNDD